MTSYKAESGATVSLLTVENNKVLAHFNGFESDLDGKTVVLKKKIIRTAGLIKRVEYFLTKMSGKTIRREKSLNVLIDFGKKTLVKGTVRSFISVYIPGSKENPYSLVLQESPLLSSDEINSASKIKPKW